MSVIKKVKIDTNQYDIDAASVDGHTMEPTGISSNTTTIPTTAQVKSYVDGNAGGITISEDSSIYIYLLPAGIYKFTYNGAKTFYYTSGNTISDSDFDFSKNIILTISTSGNYKVWYMLNGLTGQYLISGYANGTGSQGSYRKHDVSKTYLTSHQTMKYRPIQVNGTQILANTSNAALNLGNSGNVTFSQASGGTIKADINLDAIYPVGAIYLSVNSTSPASLFGGTWSQLEDRFLLGAGTTYTAGNTGGASSHNHTLGNDSYAKIGLQSDRLTQTNSSTSISGGVNGKTIALSGIQNITNWSMDTTSSLGGVTESSSNLPPYLVVYMWKRTA